MRKTYKNRIEGVPMKTINVTFNTLTPIYFGDAKQYFIDIRPSAILGCMRFWLDVANVGLSKGKITMDQMDELTKNTNKKEDSKPNINEIILKKLFENTKDISWDNMILEEYKDTFKKKKCSDLLFGCEDFKGNITIEEINVGDENKNNQDEEDGGGSGLSNESKKENNDNEDNKNNERSSIANGVIYFEFKKGKKIKYKIYIGEFSVRFKVNELLLEDYFYPLLYFINEVGYLGGKWNLGFGRVEVVKVIDESIKQEIDLRKYGKFAKCITIESSRNYNIETHFKNIKQGTNDNQGKVVKFIIEEDNESNENKNKNKNKNEENTYKTYITGALKEKIKYRDIIREKTDEEKQRKEEDKEKDKEKQRKEELKYLRHKVFGAAGKEDIQGSKILPYVEKDDSGNFETGFLLLDGLYDLKGGGNKSE